MNIQEMTDEQIKLALSEWFDLMRRRKRIPDEDIISKSGVSGVTLNKFRQNKGNVTLETFIKLLRGIDELTKLQPLLDASQRYNPKPGSDQSLPKRIRKPAAYIVAEDSPPFAWGDEIDGDEIDGDKINTEEIISDKVDENPSIKDKSAKEP